MLVAVIKPLHFLCEGLICKVEIAKRYDYKYDYEFYY